MACGRCIGLDLLAVLTLPPVLVFSVISYAAEPGEVRNRGGDPEKLCAMLAGCDRAWPRAMTPPWLVEHTHAVGSRVSEYLVGTPIISGHFGEGSWRRLLRQRTCKSGVSCP
jgi:hypothetical protein